MNKQRSHAVKNHPGKSHAAEYNSDESRVLPLHLNPARKKEMPAFLAWPSHLFEMMLMPWRSLPPQKEWRESWKGFTPLEAWVENRRGSKYAFPKTESWKTDKAYFYSVELPGVTRDQIALHFHNGSIVLSVEISESQNKGGVHVQRARSIHRAFTLPVYTDGKAITAEFKNELLTITIPKANKSILPQSRTISLT